ncbi:MAG TPA: TlpA disulfide reductase family protein [Candidatus Binataceae bacterium]|nr:TlpA disulfide reductase family protein [Candidatus Binataceae bacterium]
MNRRLLQLIAIAAVAAGVTLIVASNYRRHGAGESAVSRQQEQQVVPAGAKAADFKLEKLDGTTLSLDQLRGKVIFLNIWATWCGPCREEMPSMETLYDEFKGNQDFVMLAVSQDTKGRSVVAPYVAKNSYHFTILLDPENKVGESYDVSGVPETFIIDRKGQIVAHHMGAFDWSRPDVKDALKQLLDSKEG